MHLDNTNRCVNFRDVGEFVNVIAGALLLPEQRLYRGGKLDDITSPATIATPATIINLRKSSDPASFGADIYNFPISNDYEKYETQRREVRQWLNQVVQVFEQPDLHYPVLIHCTAGRDRTGVVVAALLRIALIPDHVIVDEYMLSDGDVRVSYIQQALDGMGDSAHYFNRVNIQYVRANLLGLSQHENQ